MRGRFTAAHALLSLPGADKHPHVCRYRDLGRAVLGPHGAWAVVPFQWSVLIGLAVTYNVTAGQSLQAIGSTACNEAAGVSGAGGGCAGGLAASIAGFGALQLLLSQLRDFHSLWCACAGSSLPCTKVVAPVEGSGVSEAA